MKTLELKHLAAYLPYGVQMYNAKYTHWFVLNPENIGNIIFSEIKPILRPLSDIGKMISINGERINPFSVLAKRASEYIPEKDLNKKAVSELLGNYSQVEKLLSWHFDIFGLIESGLAININYLNNGNKTI